MDNDNLEHRKAEMRRILEASRRSRGSGGSVASSGTQHRFRRHAGASWSAAVLVSIGWILVLWLVSPRTLGSSVIASPVGLALLVVSLVMAVVGGVLSARPGQRRRRVSLAIVVLAVALIVMGLRTIYDLATLAGSGDWLDTYPGYILCFAGSAMVGVAIEVFHSRISVRNGDLEAQKEEMRRLLDASGWSRRSGRRDGGLWTSVIVVMIGGVLLLWWLEPSAVGDSLAARPVGLVVLTASLVMAAVGAGFSLRPGPRRGWVSLAIAVLAVAVTALGLSTLIERHALSSTTSWPDVGPGFMLLVGAVAMIGLALEVFRGRAPGSGGELASR